MDPVADRDREVARRVGSEGSETLTAKSSDPQLALHDEHLSALVLDSINEGVVVADLDGRFTLWNPAATELLGMGADDVPPERWGEHYHVLDPETLDQYPSEQLPLVRAIRGESVDDAELVIWNPRTAKKVHVSCNARPLRDADHRLIGGVVIFHDVTQRRRVEKELRAFAHSVSHDLKSPLTGIMGFVGMLKRVPGITGEKRAAECVAHIEAAAKRMNRLIDDLLEHARLGDEWAKLEPVRLRDVVENALVSLAREVTAAGATVAVEDGLPTVIGYRAGLEQLMQNLLSNAIKFSSRTTPQISVGCTPDPGCWRIFVRDNGIGIDGKYLGAIFDVFRRLHTDSEYPGTGIGLSIVKKVAELHGGAVTVESSVGNGSTFWVQLPKNPGRRGAIS